jgi:hypothetical protein
MLTTKSEVSIFKTKGLEMFTWIKSGVVMKKKPSKIKRHYKLQLPKKKVIFFSQPSERGHYWKIVGNEMSIKVGKSKKTLDIGVAQSIMV